MSAAAEEAFGNLVAAARAEQGISAEEQKVLNAHVLKLGIDPHRARELQVAAEAENPPRIRIPKDVKGRVDTLRAVLEVVAADGTIAPKELAVAKALAERLGIRGGAFDGLLKAALKKRLDRAFASLNVEGIEGPERVELRMSTPPRAPLRALPFAARLSPAERRCRGCLLSFAHRDAYAEYCRPCQVNHGVSNLTGGRIESLTGLLFALLFVPLAFLVERWTGLWTWGWYAASTERPRYTWSGRRRSTGMGYLVPAAAVTAFLAFLAAWAISSGVRAWLRGRR